MEQASPVVAEADLRLRRPERAQVLLQPCAHDELLPPDHDARMIWEVVTRLDLSEFYEPNRTRGSAPGRRATDTASRAIADVEVTHAGSYVNESEPMRKQVEQAYNVMHLTEVLVG